MTSCNIGRATCPNAKASGGLLNCRAAELVVHQWTTTKS
eukprot:CAMPEP_0203991722 /NCGR_PEP_ID=MMETSP0360-20130528/9612_1 /ASSEMBLY_ACC=CAM_ASM_000342 /TAXON_ID=268821 /ORGANISM="Scrippsiella Hangoei, Strain SHTV-5" /LENGTH=38 /DNA_ID= /DNA_START= /DNA_END= /DNA_ORIENTATION=